MSRLLTCLLLIVASSIAHAQIDKIPIYCLPGQGADARQFDGIYIDTALYEIRVLAYGSPLDGEGMEAFAARLLNQIDTSKSFYLMGVSLGGMLCVEINELFTAEKVVLISSAACKQDLPLRYRVQQTIPLYKMIPPKAYLTGALFLQPLVEPDSRHVADLCSEMLHAKEPDYMKRTVSMIIEWERTTSDADIIRIHGSKDHTIPYRRIAHIDYLIAGGSHMMILTQKEIVNYLLAEILN